MVREHRPQPPQRLGRDARAQLRDLALEVCADEVLAPAQADRVSPREEAVWEAASDPELVQLLRADLGDVERRRVRRTRSSPPGSRPTGPAGRSRRSPAAGIGRCPEPSRLPWSITPRSASKRPGARWISSRMTSSSEWSAKYSSGSARRATVRGGLQIQVDRWPSLGDRQGERGLAGLPRPEEGDGRRLIQQRGDFSGDTSLYHPCNYKPQLEICTVGGSSKF